MKMNSSKTKKISLLTALVIVIAAALALFGTYAWQDFSQHKSNDFYSGNLEDYDVTLIEDFEQVDNWKQYEQVTKQIRVKNTGVGDNAGPVYVRLQLKEYMEVSEKITDTYSEKRYMIDTDGEFIRFDTDTYTTAAEALAELEDYAETNFQNEYTFQESDLKKDKGYYDDKEYWYVMTKGGDANGQYGKFLLLTSGYKTPVPIVDGAERSHDATEEHQKIPNGECDYEIHHWSDLWVDNEVVENCTHGFHDFITWNLGSNIAHVRDWDQWASGGDEFAKWYLDPTDGYAYWGVPLYPGEETDNLLESVTLEEMPIGPFYYTIHTELEAASLDDINMVKPPKIEH